MKILQIAICTLLILFSLIACSSKDDFTENSFTIQVLDKTVSTGYIVNEYTPDEYLDTKITSTYQYNNKGLVINALYNIKPFYEIEEELFERYNFYEIFTYDKVNRIIESHSNSNKINYAYNNDNLLDQITSEYNNQIEVYGFIYNDKKQLITETYKSPKQANFSNLYEYFYNEKGNVIRTQGPLFTIEYEYDSNPTPQIPTPLINLYTVGNVATYDTTIVGSMFSVYTPHNNITKVKMYSNGILRAENNMTYEYDTTTKKPIKSITLLRAKTYKIVTEYFYKNITVNK